MYSDAYLEGIRLFNAEHFWHAHEQWEQCWLQTSGADAVFYKGIIQAAAALVKWQRGMPRGMHRNWDKSRSKLVTLPSPYMGIDVHVFMAQMEQFLATAHDPVPPPIPRIELLDTIGPARHA